MKHFIDSIPAHVWVLLRENKVIANIVWRYTKSRVYCSMCVYGYTIYADMQIPKSTTFPEINYSKIAYADGGGYCKFSAAFENLMLMYGFKIRDVGGVGESAVERWLEETFVGTKVWRII